MRLDARMLAVVPSGVRGAVLNLPPVKRFTNMVLRDLKLPPQTLSFITYPTRFDTRNAERALKGSKIAVPDLESYAWRVWDYWERHLDPDLFRDRSFEGAVNGKRVVITGASSGIGRAAAIELVWWKQPALTAAASSSAFRVPSILATCCEAASADRS